MTGYIKLRRSLKEWEWYSDHNATRLLIHLLISVNYEDKKWRGIEVKRGSMIFSWDSLSRGCGMSIKQCRSAMKKLEKSGEVGRKKAGRFQLLSLLKWEKMQIEKVKGAGSRADEGQDEGRMRATTKEREERKEGEEEKAPPLEPDKITGLYDRFMNEVANGDHAEFIEAIYMSFRLKKGSLTKLLPEFKGQLITDNKLHPNTLELRKHFKSWLHVQDRVKKLNKYRRPEHR